MDDTAFNVVKVAAPLRRQVVDGIRRAITTGRFRGNDRLIERDLCEMAGVSRTLIREALRQLEAEGLVKVIPNKGPIVAVVSAQEARNVYQVRAELEGLASQLFAENASAAQIAGLRKSFRELKAAYASGNATDVLEAKDVFYDRLVEGAGNEVLGNLLRQLHSRAMMLAATSLSQKGRMALSEMEMEKLVAAILRRDGKAARTAAAAHVKRAAEVALSLLEAEETA
ncbi:MAG: GntR family transcriptional regulator [Rhodospirillales bacterium]|nr:GntR family transcriptional regulator [Rhodospirillales bacterium]